MQSTKPKRDNNLIPLAGQVFYSTQIPVRLQFLAKNAATDAKRGFRDRLKQTLFSNSHPRSRVESERATLSD